MRSAFAILALAGLSQAKVFLFNAEKCNTNFDNEANWMNVSVPPQKKHNIGINAFNYNCTFAIAETCTSTNAPACKSHPPQLHVRAR